MKPFLLAACLALLPAAVRAVEADPHDLTGDQRALLQRDHDAIAVINDLLGRKVIVGTDAAKYRQVYLDEAAAAVGRPAFTLDEFNLYFDDAQKVVGFGVFLNIVIVLAGVVLFSAVIGLFVYYFWARLKAVPVSAWEVAAWAAVILFLLSGYLWPPFTLWVIRIHPVWFVIPAALALPGVISLTRHLHFLPGKARVVKDESEEVAFGPAWVSFPVAMFGACTIVWGGLAVFYHRLLPEAGVPHVLAFLAVVAFQATLGFSVVTLPGCIGFGWTEKRRVPRSTVASFIILLGYIGARLCGATLSEDVSLFETGALFMGAFVYYLGLLVLSSRWYATEPAWDEKTNRRYTKGWERYAVLQGIAVMSGLAALYLGASFHIGTLLGVGGTLFALYLMEKYWEIPWKGIGWAWAAVGMGVALYFFVGFAGQHPEFFVWGIR